MGKLKPGIEVPKDYIESGSGKRFGWVFCHFHGATIEEVKKKKKNYFAQYPPQGYDTHTMGDIYRHPDGYYSLKVQRWPTCD